MRFPTQLRLAGLALTALVLFGSALACSFSKSSESSSDSSTSPSKSSKSSSGEQTARFLEDVEQYTAAFFEAWCGDAARDADAGEPQFLTGLGDLARQRGISDWEAELGAWESIGRGLGRADVPQEQSRALAGAWTGGDAQRETALERGYASAR